MNDIIFIKKSDFDELVKWLKAVYKRNDAFDNSETEPCKYSQKGNYIKIRKKYFLCVDWIEGFDIEYWEEDKNYGCVVSDKEECKDLRLCLACGEEEYGYYWDYIFKQDAESDISALLKISNINVAQTEEEEKKAIDLDEIVNFDWY